MKSVIEIDAGIKRSTTQDLRLGSLLKMLFLLPEAKIESALLLSHQTGMPLGSVLIARGLLQTEELRALIHAQSLLKDGLVDEATVKIAIKHLKGQPMGIEGALKMAKWHRDLTQQSNRLGELLLAAKVLTQLQLAKGLAHHRNTLEPLGRTLARLGALSKKALEQTLSIQEQIRAGALSRMQGIELIGDICARCEIAKNADRILEELVETIVDFPGRVRNMAMTAQAAAGTAESLSLNSDSKAKEQADDELAVNFQSDTSVRLTGDSELNSSNSDALMASYMKAKLPVGRHEKLRNTHALSVVSERETALSGTEGKPEKTGKRSAFVAKRHKKREVDRSARNASIRSLRKACIHEPSKINGGVKSLLKKMFDTIVISTLKKDKTSPLRF